MHVNTHPVYHIQAGKFLVSYYDFVKPGAPACGRCMPGFLKLIWCGGLYVCVCVWSAPRLLITSGVMWSDIDSI